MAKAKEGVTTAGELKAQMSELLGVDRCLEKRTIKDMEETFLKLSEEKGEKRAKEALDLANKAVSLIGNSEFKGILILNILSRLPIALQKTIIEGQEEIITSAIMSRLQEKTGEDPIKGLMLMAAAIQSIEEK